MWLRLNIRPTPFYIPPTPINPVRKAFWKNKCREKSHAPFPNSGNNREIFLRGGYIYTFTKTRHPNFSSYSDFCWTFFLFRYGVWCIRFVSYPCRNLIQDSVLTALYGRYLMFYVYPDCFVWYWPYLLVYIQHIRKLSRSKTFMRVTCHALDL